MAVLYLHEKHDLFPRKDINSKHRSSRLSGRQKYERDGKVELRVSGGKSELKNCCSEPQSNIMNQSGIKLLGRK